MKEVDYSAHLLLRPLAEELPGPSKVSVVKAMRDGRRMRHRRWWAGGSAVVAAVTAASVGGVLAAQPPRPKLPPDPPLPTACAVDRLPLGNHRSAAMPAGDASGTWLAAGSDWGRETRNSLLIWRDGVLVTDVLSPGLSFYVAGVNGSGTVVGTSKVEPYVYQDGTFRRLLGGGGEANAINDDGVIAGLLGTTDQERRPVRWASAGARPEPLTVPKGVSPLMVSISGVTDDGSVIGSVGTFGYIWSSDGSGRYVKAPPRRDGVPAEAPQPGASPPITTVFHSVVVRNGWIYGTRGSLDVESLRYHIETGTWQELAGEWKGPQIGDPYSLGDEDPRVFVGRAVLDLPVPAGGHPGRDRYYVSTVSDDATVMAGKLEGAVDDTTTPAQPIIWRCRQ